MTRVPVEGSLILLTWDDAYCVLGEESADADECLVHTVGWVHRRSARSVWIASEKTPMGMRSITRVPLAIVRCVQRMT